jgi:hypothetical protein
MVKRPRRVTVLSWFAILWGVATLYPKLFALLDADAYEGFVRAFDAMNAGAPVRLPLWFHVAYSLLASLVLVASGWFMLRARRWARGLFVIWCASSLLMTLAAYGLAPILMLRAVTFLLLVLALVGGRGAEFFAKRPAPAA